MKEMIALSNPNKRRQKRKVKDLDHLSPSRPYGSNQITHKNIKEIDIMNLKANNNLILKVCLSIGIKTSTMQSKRILPNRVMTQTMMIDKIGYVLKLRIQNQRLLSTKEFPQYLCLLKMKD